MGQPLSNKVKNAGTNWKQNVAAGGQEAEETGKSLAEKQAQVDAVRGAITPISTETKPAYVASPSDLIHQAPIKGEHRIDTSSYSNPAIKTPVYDNGGDVKPYKQNSGELLSRGLDPQNAIMKHTSTASGRDGKHKGVGQISLYDKGGEVNIVGGTNNNMTMRKLAPVYDAGGTVNVNDGKHQLAILQKGERVLTPEQNQQFKKEHGMKGFNKIPVYDEGTPDVVVDPDKQQQLIQPSLTDEQRVKQDAQQKVRDPGAHLISSDVPNQVAAPKDELIPASTASDAERLAIKTDQQKAMGQGVNGLVGLGTANLHARSLGITPAAPDTSAPPVSGRIAPTTGIPKIAEPSTSDVNGQITPSAAPTPTPAPRDMYQAQAGGPLIPSGGEDETSGQRRDLAGMERKGTLAQYDQRIAAARNSGDETTADKLMLAKMEYQRNQPWADRSLLSKVGRIASGIGNIAGDIVAPGTMALIPGTALNRAMKEKAAYGRISTDTENDLKEAQAGVANAKPAAQSTYKEATQGGIWNPATQQYEQAFVDEKDPSKIKFAGPMPPKTGAEKTAPANADQQSDYKQRIANSGLTGQALQVYGAVPKGATTAELDKRFDEATKLRGMNQKDQETLIQNQARQDAAAEKQFEHEETRDSKLINYRDNNGDLVSGTRAEAKAAGVKDKDMHGETSAPLQEKSRQAYTQYGRILENTQQAEDTMGAWDNETNRRAAMDVSKDYWDHVAASVGLVGGGVSPEYLQQAINSDAYRKMDGAGREHMQNMFQLWSDAINIVKQETGGVPRGQVFLQKEDAILPHPDKTADMNEKSLKNLAKRIHTDSKEYARPSDINSLVGGIVPRGAHVVIGGKDGKTPIGYATPEQTKRNTYTEW